MGKKVFLYLLPLFLATWVFMAFPDPVEAAQPTVRTDPAQEAWGTTALLKGRVTAINSSPQVTRAPGDMERNRSFSCAVDRLKKSILGARPGKV